MKNLRNITYDIGDYLNKNLGNILFVSVITKKPKLIISNGFFYYMNGELITNKSLYLYYDNLLERIKNINFTLICEYDKLNFDNPKELNLKVIDCINNISILPYESIHNILFNIISTENDLGMGINMSLGKTIPLQGLESILKYQINKEKATGFIFKTSKDKDDYKQNKLDSCLFLPKIKINNGKLTISFMLNGKPISEYDKI